MLPTVVIVVIFCLLQRIASQQNDFVAPEDVPDIFLTETLNQTITQLYSTPGISFEETFNLFSAWSSAARTRDLIEQARNRLLDNSSALVALLVESSKREFSASENQTAAAHVCDLHDILHHPAEQGSTSAALQCIPRFRALIIVPFRDRAEHLATFLRNITAHVALHSWNSAKILIVEQAGNKTFNKGILFNAAVTEAVKRGLRFDCVICHDVDLLPIDVIEEYTCQWEGGRHMSVNVSDLDWLPYNTMMGGVTAFSLRSYLKINGYSNIFFGWGGEDDDVGRRTNFVWGRVDRRYDRFPEATSHYWTQHHDKRGYSKRNMASSTRGLLPHSGNLLRRTGLHNVRYNTVFFTQTPQFHHLKVKVPIEPWNWYDAF